MYKIFLLLFFFFSSIFLFSQIKVAGTVYDITKKTPLEVVSVLSTSGKGVVTDSLGRYQFLVNENDSIFFSYLNKETMKFPVKNISNLDAFEISLHIKINEFPMVTVRQRNYRLDSLQNRLDYAKIFNFKKPGIGLTSNPSPGGVGVGIDLESLINMFRFKRNRSILKVQERLLQEEQDKYVSHRFNKYFVRRLTQLQAEELISFMRIYRPSYEFTLQCNDLELGLYIQKCFGAYKKNKK